MVTARRRTVAGWAWAVTGILTIAVGLIVLLTPFDPGGAGAQTCGNAVVSATAPTNDDSWISLCADKRSARRDYGGFAVFLGVLPAAAGTARLVSVRRWG